MKSWSSFMAALFVGLVLAVAPARAADPYTVTVWARVLFGVDGKAGEFTVIDEAAMPTKFVEGVKARVSRMRIPPPMDGDKPATLRSGVRLDFVVTPSDAGGSVRLDKVSMEPLPVARFVAPYPDDLAKTGGWESGVAATCQVAVDGRCASVTVLPQPGLPESVRRFAKASLERWTFEPQRLNDRPIEGESTTHFTLRTPDSAPEDFRQSRFDRLMQVR
jgi:hypothetical protein